MPLYIFARFEPRPGKRDELVEELTRVIRPTRAEPGCIRINAFESTRGPCCFYIHSEWIDEPAFDAHAELPHTMHFLSRLDDLITHPLHVVRTRQIV